MAKTCFFVSPIGGPDSKVRAHSDALLAYVVQPVCKGAGYEVLRGDEDRRPGDITDQVIERVLESDLVIADLSFLNPNVFYEIGLRHATARPIIHMYRVEGELPFDVASYRAITFDCDPWDARGHQTLCASLAEQVAHAEAEDYKGPVSNALAVTQVQRSEDPGHVMLQKLMSRFDWLERRVTAEHQMIRATRPRDGLSDEDASYPFSHVFRQGRLIELCPNCDGDEELQRASNDKLLYCPRCAFRAFRTTDAKLPWRVEGGPDGSSGEDGKGDRD